jgi:hypothetical protein
MKLLPTHIPIDCNSHRPVDGIHVTSRTKTPPRAELHIQHSPMDTGYSKCSAAGSKFTTWTVLPILWQCSCTFLQYVDCNNQPTKNTSNSTHFSPKYVHNFKTIPTKLQSIPSIPTINIIPCRCRPARSPAERNASFRSLINLPDQANPASPPQQKMCKKKFYGG